MSWESGLDGNSTFGVIILVILAILHFVFKVF